MDLSRANLLAGKTEDHFMPGCFGGKQLVKTNCEVRSYCQVSRSTHTNPNLLLTMEPGSKS